MHDFWLYDYSNFRALKERFSHRSHLEWKNESESKDAILNKKKHRFISLEAEKHAFTQFIFYKQFQRLKKYANDKGIQLIGDLPIFVALDSADVWANSSLFDLNSKGFPNKVGVCLLIIFRKTDNFGAIHYLIGRCIKNKISSGGH